MTGIDRRRFLSASGGLAAGSILPAGVLGVGLETLEVAGAVTPGTKAGNLFAAAAKDRQGRFIVVLFDPETGREAGNVVLPARGHDIAVRPSNGTAAAGVAREVVAFARQPGNFAVVLDDKATRDPLWFTSRDDRHFHGHGVFSRDGRLLYTTENDFEAGIGIIGVRDATRGYTQIGEFASGGTDPHDLKLLSDGRTVVVANGGIKTHPAMPRRELNLSTMQPSLAYIDTVTGDLLERHEFPGALHQLSIRHLSVGAGDTVLFGCQFKGARWQTQAIAGRHRRGTRLELLELPGGVQLAMRNYVASVAVDRQGSTGVITAPFGGMAVFIDIASGRYLGQQLMDNVFGVAPGKDGHGFVLTSGNGPIASVMASDIGAASGMRAHQQSLVAAWDNHLVAVG